MKRLWWLLLFPSCVLAQQSNSAIILVTSAPSGACTSGLPDQQIITTGILYSCQSGMWSTVGGGGGTWPGYPGLGIVVSTGSAWDTSLTETDGNILFGAAGAWTKGTALPNGITATTQSQADGSTKVATTAYADTGLATKVPTTRTVNGHALSSNVTVTASDVSLGNVTNDAQTKAAVVPNTAPSAGQIPVGNAGNTAYVPQSISGDATLASTGAMTLASKYKTWSCQPGLGDGTNAMTAATYLQSECWNTTGVTVTLTGISCYTDNSGSSTLNAAGNTLGALLTGAVTCSSSLAAGSQSANVALTNGDYIKFTFVADGTSKQTTWVVTGTY